MTIYVQIPAYRDRELSRTLLDLYSKADDPARLRVCVVWQHADDEVLDPAVLRLPRLEILPVPFQESLGCNWARCILQSRWRGEPYTLLLDSHHRFVRGWDRLLVSMYEGLVLDGIKRPLLTAYLPPYDPDREPHGRKTKPYKIYPAGRDDGVLTRLTSFPIPLWRSLKAPIPAEFLSLHFTFTAGDFNADVPFDPEIYFLGDETLTGLRAFTCGFDMFHPHIVLGWHSYDRTTRVTHWQDHQEWCVQQQRSIEKLRTLFLGKAPGQLGTARTVRDYEDHIMASLVEDE